MSPARTPWDPDRVIRPRCDQLVDQLEPVLLRGADGAVPRRACAACVAELRPALRDPQTERWSQPGGPLWW